MDYKLDQFRSEVSRKSAENKLEWLCPFICTNPGPSTAVAPTPNSSQSIESGAESTKSEAEWLEKLMSHVSIGHRGWSRILGVLSIWLWRSTISVVGPPGSTPSNGLPVVLSRKSSRRPAPVAQLVGTLMEGGRGSAIKVLRVFSEAGERLRGEKLKVSGVFGRSLSRTGSGDALKFSEISVRWRKQSMGVRKVNFFGWLWIVKINHQKYHLHAGLGCQTGRQPADGSHFPVTTSTSYWI